MTVFHIKVEKKKEISESMFFRLSVQTGQASSPLLISQKYVEHSDFQPKCPHHSIIAIRE